MLEIIGVRWGRTAHLVFMFFAFATNILVSAMLILGGAAVTTALTNINIYAASMLIPVGVILYTAAGGLKATFMASYIHTGILYIALLIFTFKIYASTEPGLGSPSKVCTTHLSTACAIQGWCVCSCSCFHCVSSYVCVPPRALLERRIWMREHARVSADVRRFISVLASAEQNVVRMQVWDKLDVISNEKPVDKNRGGSLLTMLSESGLIFGVINIVGASPFAAGMCSCAIA